jgi:rfaE bifunctional protein kinase chain/domain
MVNGIIASKTRSTTVKTRVLSGGNQLLRIDEEITYDLDTKDEANFINLVLSTLNKGNIDLVIFEDYDKGLITKNVIDRIVEQAKKLNIPIAVDPKKKNFSSYANVSLFKPNLKELKQGLKVDFANKDMEAIKGAAIRLKKDLNLDCVLLTLSELGILVCQQDSNHTIPAHYRDVTDVSGAGDTVISVAALCYALGMEPADMAALSNLAGGIVCEKVGVVPIDKNQLWTEAKALLTKGK